MYNQPYIQEMDKIMKTLDNTQIILFVLAAVKEHRCVYLSLFFCLFTLFCASVNALQTVFSNSSYECIAKCETSDCQRGQIVGAHLAGASVTKTATLLGVSRPAVSKDIMATQIMGRHHQLRGGQKPKLSERDHHTFKNIVSNDHRLQQR